MIAVLEIKGNIAETEREDKRIDLIKGKGDKKKGV